MKFYDKIKELLKHIIDLLKKHPIKSAITLIIILFIISFEIGVFKYRPLLIVSKSMTPSINVGDIIIYEEYKKGKVEVNVGDVILYKLKDGRTIVHRVVEKSPSNYVETYDICFYKVKGDANIDEDPYTLMENNFYGKMKFRIRWLGYPIYLIYKLFGLV